MFFKATKTPTWQKFLNDSQLDGEFVKAAELTASLSKFEGQLREILKESGAKWCGKGREREAHSAARFCTSAAAALS
jgi:hypothetical protein